MSSTPLFFNMPGKESISNLKFLYVFSSSWMCPPPPMLRVLSQMPPFAINSFLPMVLMAITERRWGKRSWKIGWIDGNCRHEATANASISKWVFVKWVPIYEKQETHSWLLHTLLHQIFVNEFAFEDEMSLCILVRDSSSHEIYIFRH